MNPTIVTEDYIFMFLFKPHLLYSRKNATEIHLWFKLASLLQFNSTRVDISPAARKEICQELGISAQNVTNCLRGLKEGGLIVGEGGTFYLDPEMVWKGTMKDREKWSHTEQGIEVMRKFAEVQMRPEGGADE